MVGEILKVKLSYDGNTADEHEVDFYDVTQGLLGFQRSLALTTHLVLNGEVITQAPFLRGARIADSPPAPGSWELWAAIYITGKAAYKIGTMPRDTPLGHAVYSAYDFVVSSVLGVHIDYAKPLGIALEEKQKIESSADLRMLTYSKLDALAEKCEHAIAEIHRPIVKTGSASTARLIASVEGKDLQVGPTFDEKTYDYIAYTRTVETVVAVFGFVSSYNMNTYKGRIFVPSIGRPIPFELAEQARDHENEDVIGDSLGWNIKTRGRRGKIECECFELLSRTGQLKRYLILGARPSE